MIFQSILKTILTILTIGWNFPWGNIPVTYNYTELAFLEKMVVNVNQDFCFVFAHDGVNYILVPMHNVMDMKYLFIYFKINVSQLYDLHEHCICTYFKMYCIGTSSFVRIIFVLDWCMLFVQAQQSIIPGLIVWYLSRAENLYCLLAYCLSRPIGSWNFPASATSHGLKKISI